ncbi:MULTISPECIES: hypothetical protein [Bacillaceae]|jgi:hypothetical protein|uniref:Uncharacterized protein n=1 Tax=Cytobacillus firmus TaxID=1399 RepID=A0AA46SKK0_CYTFI|nr:MULTISPECIES: hypothetical protein [Bacillaceae]KML39746.1 hypothetical protein VL14_15585 [Cytobacillus firmus]MCC3645472.1 hypothetical protein [Cytobacillus oceanisediminis]MCS0652085.1 hypothetical protein [Cytobacillus firmus]MCU1804706.1 hypothetical protein [Cytobacillus firmus]UYG96590.1 hypothetical protein OD459_06045 [Cytobacillus firmus]
MKHEKEKAYRVKSLSQDILEHLMEDNTIYRHEDLKHVIEMLARSVSDLVTLYTEREADHETALKGTISKMRIGYNVLQYKETSKMVRKQDKYHQMP